MFRPVFFLMKKWWYNTRMKTILSKSREETTEFAKRFVESLLPKTEGATVVCLYGDLGSGKTTFIQAAAKTFGVDENVTSPTFVIEKVYELKHPHFRKFFHIDAYRLGSGDELLALGWNEMIKDAHNIVFIEWPVQVADILPKDARNLTFTFVDDTTRKIDVG